MSGARRTAGIWNSAASPLRIEDLEFRVTRHSHAQDVAAERDLLETIESEVIPRLAMVYRNDEAPCTACPDTRPPPTTDEIFEFAHIAACQDLVDALAFIEKMCRDGLAIESLLLDLVAPAARVLGEQWAADLRSFSEVSAGLCTLNELVHVFGSGFNPSASDRGRVILTLAKGEQHSLGLFIIGELLRKAGFGVQVNPTMSSGELVDTVAMEHVDVVGFSVSNDDLLEPLGKTVQAVRRATCNPDMLLLVGGPIDLSEFTQRHGLPPAPQDPREVVRYIEHHAARGRYES